MNDDRTVTRDMEPDGGTHWRLNPDETVGPFRVLRALGRGGMGEVYEVEHIHLSGTRSNC